MDWGRIKHFDREEFDYPNKIFEPLLVTVDYIRDRVGDPFFITSDYRPGDSRLHGLGRALDWATPTSRSRQKWRYQEQMWKVASATYDAFALGFTDGCTCQLELVQGPIDWHFHLGLYQKDAPQGNRIILALD